MNLRNMTVSVRRKAFEKELKISLGNIGHFSLEEKAASSRNCENMIGVAQIPLGVAGPVNGTHIPLATTEGALVASVNRGCKVIRESGGATSLVVRVGASRGPVFKVHNLEENSMLFTFISTHRKQFDALAKNTSKHITLTSVETNSVGLYRFVRFTFDTQDAMGLNMVTIATDAIVRFIEKETGTKCVSLAGNYDVDKKPSWANIIRGRGFEVWAEVTIPNRVLKSVLKTSASALYDTWLAKCMMGSAMSGSMGFNAQYANIVAAMFLATGQDPAHVVEGSLGITTVEVRGKDAYVSVYLPDLLVGTVGGGTGLATQREALSLMKVKHSTDLAKAVGLGVLAGEISLLSSLSVGSLAQSHKRLARGGR